MEEIKAGFEARLVQLAEQVDRLTKEQDRIKAELSNTRRENPHLPDTSKSPDSPPPSDPQSLSIASETSPDPLFTEITLEPFPGHNYIRLDYLLKAGRWKEADEETGEQLAKLTRNSNIERITKQEAGSIGWQYLEIIERLWLKYSHGKFGFSLQNQLYRQVGGHRESKDAVLTDLGNLTGWFKDGDWIDYENVVFDLEKAIKGHLPYIQGLTLEVYKYIVSRQEWSRFNQYTTFEDLEKKINLMAEKQRVKFSYVYQEELAQKLAQERETLINTFFKAKFSEIDSPLLAVKSKLLELSQQDFAYALLQFQGTSREALLEQWVTQSEK